MTSQGSQSDPLADKSLLEIVDRLLDHGVAVRGELWLTVADVDLLFVGLDVVLASPDKMGRTRQGALPPPPADDPRHAT